MRPSTCFERCIVAERKLAVSLIIGGAVAPSLKRSFQSAERTGLRSSQAIVGAMKKAQLGETLSADVIRYQTTLEQLRAKQAQLGTSSKRLTASIAAAEKRYHSAKQAAEKYGITIGKVADEHRQLAQAARRAERRVARSEAGQRNRDTRSQVQGQILSVAAPALLLAQPIKQAIAFESVLADINKVVDFKQPDGLLKMGDAILRLSTDERIPMAAAGLGDITAAAGQAGIARHELVQFTRDAAKIGVAFDLSGKAAGSAMTGLRSIFALNQKDAVLVADSYNHLSNNMDATAAGILRITSRAGSLGKLVGFTGQQIGALGATFLTLKTPPEVAATGINALITRLATAEKQPERFAEGLRSIGLSASGLKADMERDAQGTLIRFLEAVDQSEDKIGVLADLFGAEYADDIAKLVGSLDIYKKALSLVADQTQFAGSAQREYEARAATTANDLKILANQGTRLAIVTGRLLLPSLKIVATQLGKVADFAASVSERFPTLTKVVGLAAISLVTLKIAALGGRFAGTLFSDAWRAVGGTLDAVAPKLATQASAMFSMRAASLKGAGGLNLLSMRAIPAIGLALKSLSMASLFNPIGLAIAAVAVGAFLIIKYWKPLGAFFKGVGQGIEEVLGPISPMITVVVDALKTAASWWANVLGPMEASKASLESWAGAGRVVGRVIGILVQAIGSLFAPIVKATELMHKMFDAGKPLMSTLGAGIKQAGGTLMGNVWSVLGGVADLLPQSDAKAGPLSTLTASGRALVTTLGTGIKQAGPSAISEPLSRVLSEPIGPLPLADTGVQERPSGVPQPPTPRALRQMSSSLSEMGSGVTGPLSGLNLAGAGAAAASSGHIHIDMSGMTIQANTAADAQAIGDSLETRIRRVAADLARRGQATRRGALHDGDGAGLGSF